MSQILTSRQAEELYVHQLPYHFSFTCIFTPPVCPDALKYPTVDRLFAYKTSSYIDTKL